jgi:hypothetical protein
MSPRTLFLSRLIGLYCILVALSMIFVLGAITLIAGPTMVLTHNIWSGGALGVIVTLVGWITLIKSLSFLFLPPQIEAGLFLKRLHYEQLFYLYCAFSLVLGIYLTYSGFKSRSR